MWRWCLQLQAAEAAFRVVKGDLRLRLVSKPDRPVAELLVRLGVELAARPKSFENVVEEMPL